MGLHSPWSSSKSGGGLGPGFAPWLPVGGWSQEWFCPAQMGASAALFLEKADLAIVTHQNWITAMRSMGGCLWNSFRNFSWFKMLWLKSDQSWFSETCDSFFFYQPLASGPFPSSIQSAAHYVYTSKGSGYFKGPSPSTWVYLYTIFLYISRKIYALNWP